MSFVATRTYSRPILRPVSIETRKSASLDDSKVLPYAHLRQAPSESNVWTSSTHIFRGTRDRVDPRSWPFSKSDQDPSNIPDDPANNINYDPDTAKHKDGEYVLYDTKAPGEDAGVPAPRIVVKRYRPVKRNDKAIQTLLIFPGMGSPKELFEPMLDLILARDESNVVEVWAVDMPLSGETPLVNPPGYLYGNEKDIARDLLLFVTAYLPLQVSDELPTELSPRQFRTDGQTQPVRSDIHVIGHSLGAQSAMLIAAHAPDVFASLSVFDPAMIPAGKVLKAFTAMPKDVLCTGIAQLHADKTALASTLDKNRRVRGWDSRVKKMFVERAAVPTPSKGLMLTAHPRLEWALYYDQETPAHCYDRLTDLTVPLNMIVPERPFACPPKLLEADMAKLSQPTKLSYIKGATHQLPLEKVDECTELVLQWLRELQHRVSPKL